MIKRKMSGAADLDLSVFMNLMVVLIPILLAAAEFSKITIIDIEAARNGVQLEEAERNRPEPGEKLKTTLLVTNSAITIGTEKGMSESIRYSAEGGKKKAWEQTTVLDMEGKVKKAYLYKNGKLLTDSSGALITSVKEGDTHFLNGGLESVLIRDENDYKSHPLMLSGLLEVKLRILQRNFALYPDISKLTIGSEASIVYDFLVQLMDASRKSGYKDISFSMLRS